MNDVSKRVYRNFEIDTVYLPPSLVWESRCFPLDSKLFNKFINLVTAGSQRDHELLINSRIDDWYEDTIACLKHKQEGIQQEIYYLEISGEIND